MLKKVKSLKLRVSHFHVNEEGLYVVDEINRVLIFDENLNFKKGFKLKFEKNNPNENGVKINKTASFLSIASKNRLGIWNLQKRKHLGDFEFKHDIMAVGFLNDDYLACGGVDGEIYLINLEIAKQVAKLKRHKDFITDIDFVDEDYICAGSYDKGVLFYNLSSFNKKERFLHIKPTRKVKKENYLITSDEICDVIKWDEYKHTSKDRVDFYRKFADFWVDENFLLVLSPKKVMIYDLEKEVILNDGFIEFEDMDKIAFYNDKLIISTTAGEIFVRNVFEEENELADSILKEDFKKAYELIDKNPFLIRSGSYLRLKRYEEVLLKRAAKLFEINEAEAIESLQPLLRVPAKRAEIERFIEHYKNLLKFKNAVLSGNYALAYLLANRYEELKNTKYYKLLELKWEMAYNKAYELIKEDKVSEAKEILEPFMAVSEKLPVIELLLKKGKILKLFKEKLAKRDFAGAYELINQYPELKESVEYQKLMEYAKRLYERALKLLEEENFEKAKKAATLLKEIKEYKDKAQEILDRLETISKFLSLVAENRIDEALYMAEVYEFLRKLKTYKEIQEKFRKTMKEAEKLMLLNKNKALEMLGEYKSMKTKLPRINSMIEEMG